MLRTEIQSTAPHLAGRNEFRFFFIQEMQNNYFKRIIFIFGCWRLPERIAFPDSDWLQLPELSARMLMHLYATSR